MASLPVLELDEDYAARGKNNGDVDGSVILCGADIRAAQPCFDQAC
jgi:hypothetical protein